MFRNIGIILAVFGMCQDLVFGFGVPCNCGLGNGVDVCTPVKDDTDKDDESRYPLVVRPHTLPKVDIEALSPHHPHGRSPHHHHGPNHLHSPPHHHGPRSNYETDDSNIAPLKPVGDLCTCGKTIVKPANVPKPACSGCTGTSSHHHYASGFSHTSHSHHERNHHGHDRHDRDHNDHDNHDRDHSRIHHDHDRHDRDHNDRDHSRIHHGHDRHDRDHHGHDRHDRDHHHRDHSRTYHDHDRHDRDHHDNYRHDRHHHGSGHDGHHHNLHDRHHNDYNQGIRYGEGEQGHSVVLPVDTDHYGPNHIRSHHQHSDSHHHHSGDADATYYQVGGTGPERYAPEHGYPTQRSHVGDSLIDYPICGLPVLHQPKVQIHTSHVPADAISKAIVRKELQSKQAAVEHLQFGSRTPPKEETSTYVEAHKKLFPEESYYKLNGHTLELPKVYHAAPVEEVEIEEEEEPEPEPEPVVIQPISYHSIGFVPCKVPPPKFITPVVPHHHVEPIHEEIVPSCGVEGPPSCGDGYKSGQVIIKNVPISSDGSEVTCNGDEGNPEYSSGATYTYSKSTSSSSSDSQSSHYRGTGCATCGL
ncbi:sarcoplasmic reticulum histidine-rich calcium-binding protein-like [Photinus pyralis]|uniref:sarcoplasmic reticulum histidine-rich calcium-binding protein-like n=1 Tax=Photinus pyralis TaxID=7054 RepID=UPI001267532B|nr:sarcoplasmic reticulum histidine-rich calcium-binding protein-like [Photinus pyralis]